jgi:glycerophosphoryl diester phosphodiesterase
MKQGPKVIAHRGASGYAPEITLEAYRIALEMNCDGVELDVQMLQDGTLIAFHDPEVTRTTSGSGLISEHTLESIKKLDAGSWFNKAYPEKARLEYIGLQVPTLQEIFDLLKESSLELFIEIKSPELYPANFEAAILALVCENHLENRTRFLSFNSQSLLKIKSSTLPCIRHY